MREASPPACRRQTILSEGLIPGMQAAGRALQGRPGVSARDPHQRARHEHGTRRAAPAPGWPREAPTKGTVVLGTVEGDLHDIGKNLVGMLLSGNGFDVVDLGVDVSAAAFVAAAREHDADVVALSALLTTTTPQFRKVIEALDEAGLRATVAVMIGGAPVTRAAGGRGRRRRLRRRLRERSRRGRPPRCAEGGLMTVFSRQRFRDICRGERPGDFGILGNGIHIFWPETLPAWVGAGGARRLRRDRRAGLRHAERRRRASSASTSRAPWPRSTAAWTPAPRCTSTCRARRRTTTPSWSARRSSRGSSRRTRRASSSSTAPASRSGCSRAAAFNMPMWLEHPVKDRRSWDGLQGAARPAIRPSAIPPTGTPMSPRINALDCPVSMEVGGFFGYLNMWVGTEDLMYLFYDDPGLIEDMMETILHLEIEMVRRVTQRHHARLGLVLGGHGLQERPHDQPRHGAPLHAAALPEAQRGHPRRRLSRSSTSTATATSTSSSRCGSRPASTSSGRSSAPPAWTRWPCASSTARTSSWPAAWTSASSCATRSRCGARSWPRCPTSSSRDRTSRAPTISCPSTCRSRTSATTSSCCARSAATSLWTSRGA